VVDVPYGYYRRVWQERNPTPAGQEIKPAPQTELDKIEAETKKRIEETIVKLLPRPESGNDPFIPVTVTSFQDLAQTPLAAPVMADTLLAWLAANWQTLGMMVVGLVGMLMLRSMVKTPAPKPSNETSAAAVPDAAASAPPAPATNNATSETPATVKLPRRRFGATGPTLRDELREMVKENPDAAATVLRAWIGDAA
jgi:flagellar M-ring protein FliF